MLQRQIVSQKHFLLSLLGLCCFYLGFEFFFNRYAMLSVDEFWFAHRIFQYKDELPYRDFAPYKTVLGYYLLLIPMLHAKGIFQTLIFTKHCLAILNAFLLFISSCWLTRFFSRIGILTALVMMLLSEIMLSYSTNIRVDLLGYWCCFFSLLLLLEKRFLLAGLLLGLGFLTSQKSIWYMAASNCALFIEWIWAKHKLERIAKIFQFNAMMLSVIAIYFVFWSAIADGHTVYNSVFNEAKIMYQLDWYDHARKLFWTSTLLYNPLIFLLSPLTFISIGVTYADDKHYHQRLFVVTYAFTILLCLVPYKQVFPYYMQVMIPVFFILYAAFFSWLFAIFESSDAPILLIGKRRLWLGLFLYMAIICSVFLVLHSPAIYLLIFAIPFLLGFYLTNCERKNPALYAPLLCISMVFIGGIYPLTLFGMKLINMDGSYQQANIKVINSLLQDGSSYVAGIELIYNKTQPIAGMRHLMGPAIDYLASPTEKLRPVMLASLYEDPYATMASVIANLEKSPVKFYVNNYRMIALPAKLKNYLNSQYAHWWGSIYLYAPQIKSGKHSITLAFSGNYYLEADKKTKIQLDKKVYTAHSLVYFVKGNHLSRATNGFRLKLIPVQTSLLNPNFYEDRAYKLLF